MRAFVAVGLVLASVSARAADASLEAIELKARALAEKVEAANEGVFRVKARLLAMQLDAPDRPQGRVRLHHELSLGPTFRVASMRASLDGATVFEPFALSSLESPLVVFDDSLDAGRHAYTLSYDLRGASLPALPYLEGYRLQLRAECPFELRPDMQVDVSAVLHDGDLTKDFLARPAVSCEIRQAPLPPPGS